MENNSYSELFSFKSSHRRPIENCFDLWGKLHEKTFKFDTRSSRDIVLSQIAVSVAVGDDRCEPFWQDILPNHSLVSQKSHNIIFDQLIKSFEFLEENYFKSHGYLFPYLWTIFPVVAKTHAITSLTIPDFPFASFVSSQAQIHIAPDILSEEASDAFLAENILHEMVHNYVNITLLEKEILSERYLSYESPKIEIPWRKGSKKSNRHWEIDRVIHALHVYAVLYEFRKKLCLNSTNKTNENIAIIARKNANFLLAAIHENKKFLTKKGMNFVAIAGKKIA